MFSSNLMFPVDCVQTVVEGSCSVTCGDGVQQLTRTVTTEPMHDGKPCEPDTETRPCYEQACPGEERPNGQSLAVFTHYHFYQMEKSKCSQFKK